MGGLFTRAEQQELTRLALEAATLLEPSAGRGVGGPEPLVMPPDEWGTIIIWPFGEEGRFLEANIQISDNWSGYDRNQPPAPGISWGVGGHIHAVEFTRMWALAMLKACDIADKQQRPAQGGGER